MAFDFFLTCCVFVSVMIQVHLIVPPKTPVLSGFEPAAIGSYRELVCNASQPGAGTITYKWYKYSVDWECRGPIGESQKYVFNPVGERSVFYPNMPFGCRQPISGKYKCRASNSAGTRDSEWHDLYVYEPCSLYIVSVSPLKPPIGSTFTLNCHIPNPSGFAVLWLRRADASSSAIDEAVANRKGCHAPSDPRIGWSSCSPTNISSPTKTFNLQVTDAQPADFAYWICKDIGLNCYSNPVKPVVQPIPGTPKITGFPSGPMIAGTQLNLVCSASPLGDAYDWYKDGTKVSTSLTYDFHLTNESAGIYRCLARNAVGSATSSNKTLVVYYKPDSVVVSSGKTSSHAGEKDKFTCTVSGGNPTPNVKIYIKRSGGTPVEVYQGQERVMAKEDNQAEYYCEAKVIGYPALDITSSRNTYNVTFPPTTTLSSSPNPVKEGDKLTLTCLASGGNPTSYTYKWFYKNREIPNETSNNYKISSVKYTQSGTYHCQAINYLPDGKADGSVNVDVLYRAKWNPLLPESLTAQSKVNAAVKLALHVIANPSPSHVTWFYPNQTAIGENFSPSKINDTTYTLSKAFVRRSDYGNYTVNVTNAVGVSSFVFELKPSGPPQTPCCLKKVNSTAISVTLTFKSNDNGGTPQTFTIERRGPGGDWIISAKNLADPGFNKDVVLKIAGFRGNLMYEFRVKAVNDDGESGYGNILEVKTPATPNSTLTVNRKVGVVTVRWTPLKQSYSKVRIKYCQKETSSKGCSYYHLKDPTATTASFNVDANAMYDVYLEVFDGVYVVYRSAPVILPSGSKVNVGMIVGVVVAVVILIAVVGAVVMVLHRRKMACFSDQSKRKDATRDSGTGVTALTGPEAVVHDAFYMNVDNKAFQGEDAQVEPVYVNDTWEKGDANTRVDQAEYDEPYHKVHPQRVQEVVYDETRPAPVPGNGNPPRRIEDLSVDDFKQWLLSKRVTESTYKRLAKNGFEEASFFAMLQPGHIKKLRIKPLAQEVLVQKLVKSFQQENGSESGKRMKPAGDEDGDEGAYEELENPYAELNITPDVIASQTYAELKP